jgi:prevent-host-death family protein
MDISVSRFKQACLEMVRQVETTRQPVTITRRGKVVARLSPASTSKAESKLAPWERVRSLHAAVCRFEPGESVASADDFDAAR